MAELKVTYYGAAALGLEAPSGAKALIDPYLNDNPFTVRKPADFGDLGVLLVTHAAFDHFGDTVEIMKNSKARLIAGHEVCQFCIQQGIEPDRTWTTVYGDHRSSHGFTIRTVEAKHLSVMRQGDEVVSGIPFGYVITTEEGISVYHPGDTALFSDMKLYRELYRPQILLVGVSKIAEPYACELTPYEAALATQWIGPDVVIPAHYPKGSTAPHEFGELIKTLAPAAQVVGVVDQTFVYRKFEVSL
jgi:L-ascorbate metabolism protein UlaG (beta-lactamase superfamily)